MNWKSLDHIGALYFRYVSGITGGSMSGRREA
jgi:hypothetical protein